MKPISRKRALELAIAGLARMAEEKRRTLEMVKVKYTSEGVAQVESEYAELVAALQFVEGIARQRELGI